MQFDISGSEQFFAITTSDSTVLNPPLRGLTVAVAGTVKVTRKDGTTQTLTLPAGGPFPLLGVTVVWTTGTSATGLTGFP